MAMIHIKKNREPQELGQYCARGTGTSFDAMDLEVKVALRQSLLDEQGHLCAYCMRRLKSAQDVKIEHYRARTPENELQYDNLLAVCHGNEGNIPSQQTCDTKKGNRELHVNPLRLHDMELIYYTTSGEVHSSDPQADEDLDKVLNLNNPMGYLIPNRKAALQSIMKKLSELPRRREADTLLRRLDEKYNAPSAYLTPYIGIIRWYIAKRLKRYL